MSPITSDARAEWSRRLARALVAGGFVSEEAISGSLAHATEADVALSAVLIAENPGLVGVVVNTMGQLARLPTVNLETEPPAPDVMRLIPPLLARDQRAVPVRVVGKQAVLAFAEPPDPIDVGSLGDLLGYEIVPVLGDPLVIDRLLAPGARPAPAPAENGHLANGHAANGHVGDQPDSRVPSSNGHDAQTNGLSQGAPVPEPPTAAATPRHANGSALLTADQGLTPPRHARGGEVGADAPVGARVSAQEAPPPPPPPPMAPPPPPRVMVPIDPPVAADVPVPDAPPLVVALGGSASLNKRRNTDTGFRLHIDDLLRYVISIGASDLHLSANIPPTVRLHGALRPMPDIDSLEAETLREMVFGILPQTQRERFEAEHELDTSHSVAGVGRFRVNVALQRGTIAVAMRPIPHDIPEFDTLGLPGSVRSFTDLRRGLVLVTGPTGSGKSTSLASLIDIINRTKPLHIVTVEDPIEFLHTHKRCVISQREIGEDTASFSEALRRVLRQDPDVVLVGELRDLETISTALTAAETGHLVFATLHTQDAPSTIDRVIDVFPANQQEQIRIQLGSSLQGVVTQQLVPTKDGQGRVAACEVLVCTPAVQNLIRGAKTHQVASIMQTGGQFGMQTMDQSLALLVKQQQITVAMAKDRCRSEEDLQNHLSSMQLTD
ncbi:MAG TPA: PilT/PilU family type 4a pilus ATPase [Acidimicrobiales bacterium]|nr:PilT/PilU family type 4a pilus ATPase [Acidimicrobiales bacterium]